MNRLIIVEDGFIRRDLLDSKLELIDIDTAYRNNTFKQIIAICKLCLSNSSNFDILTRDKIYLLELKQYFYNEETKRFEIYILRKGELINIHDTTEKHIRKTHNLYNMYWSGTFSE